MNLQPVFENNFSPRFRSGKLWRVVFFTTTLIGIFMLILLLCTVFNNLMGYAAVTHKISPQSLAVDGVALEDMTSEQWISIIQSKVSANLLRTLEKEKPLAERSRSNLYRVVVDRVLQPKVDQTWSLTASIFTKAAILADTAEKYPDASLQWMFWLNPQFLSSSASSNPLATGVRSALLGSLWTMLITILVAFPIGVGAAIYLEEYAANNWLNRILKTNITNLAGVPSIIYGILGLAIFVRAMQNVTSGAAFGVVEAANATGRTILSAGLTLALLVLPLIIINSQEAIRTVPDSLRQASYGLGATKWQTIWHHVLPKSVPGILTGTILAISRAIGETAPLVVVGATTFINYDPTGPFSRFTTLPIQIYQWTSRPQGEFHNIAAAAILVLLVMLLSLNATAILMRNKFHAHL